MVAGFWNVSIDFPAPDMHAGEEDGDRRPSHRRESVGPDVLDDNMSIIVKIVKLIALGRRLLLKIRQDAWECALHVMQSRSKDHSNQTWMFRLGEFPYFIIFIQQMLHIDACVAPTMISSGLRAKTKPSSFFSRGLVIATMFTHTGASDEGSHSRTGTMGFHYCFSRLLSGQGMYLPSLRWFCASHYFFFYSG
ncbi:hypothetical protein PDE_03818 [Penicillium oxalicum 114-2]|uniref:Uncharacterized protein n=1 Tax=Penicillium oxalicum (strain 114-2 / CGMCC 5302) TaxID=933388 RepID=S8B346_PENO1|nr:hypothetical protein PDE_03818 [Penicillium oxalicum 114-2]